MDRYRVTHSTTRVETVEMVVWASNEEDAEEIVDSWWSDGSLEDGEMETTDIECKAVKVSEEELATHAADGTGVCDICEQATYWTGMNADDPANPTGRTIPGPWVHTVTPTEGDYIAIGQNALKLGEDKRKAALDG